jgi:hypothetical protein
MTMPAIQRNSCHRRQAANTADHAKLCNPFLPEGDRARHGNHAECRQLRVPKGS